MGKGLYSTYFYLMSLLQSYLRGLLSFSHRLKLITSLQYLFRGRLSCNINLTYLLSCILSCIFNLPLIPGHCRRILVTGKWSPISHYVQFIDVSKLQFDPPFLSYLSSSKIIELSKSKSWIGFNSYVIHSLWLLWWHSA